MRNDLLAGLCGVVLLTAMAGQAVAQENPTSENKDKNAAEKTADKAKRPAAKWGTKPRTSATRLRRA